MKLITILLLICISIFIEISPTSAQVSIGDQPLPHANAILDLTNGNSLGLLMPHSAGNPNSGSLSAAPEGLLMYYKENFFLKGSGNWFNAITPWKSIFTGPDPIDVYFNPTGFTSAIGGVGIGLSSGLQGNLHIALKTKDVNIANTSAPLLIGQSDADTHLSIDNDEILVKTNANTAGTLKLQEGGGGGVQVGASASDTSSLNVFGVVRQYGHELIPVGAIIMWSGTTIPAGWALCDGEAYGRLAGGGDIVAPDLRERFIVGSGGENSTDPVAGAGYSPGNKGGVNKVTLTELQCALPSHNHSINHGHSITDPGHNHDIDLDDSLGGGGIDDSGNGDNEGNDETSSETTGITVDNHVGNSGDKNIATAPSSHENRPPYYALAFIMKL